MVLKSVSAVWRGQRFRALRGCPHYVIFVECVCIVYGEEQLFTTGGDMEFHTLVPHRIAPFICHNLTNII